MTSKSTTTTSHPPNETSKSRAVAYYRSTLQEGDESIESQREDVRRWAAEKGIEIIREFTDSGETGRHTEVRQHFSEMMEEWVKKDPSFRYILCLDVARWGRFVDIDLSAHYTAECARAGKEVVYTAMGKAPDGDHLYPMFLYFERMRVADFRRELGHKVRRGRMLAAQKGYWVGGNSPYGMRRLLLDKKDKPLHILQSGERKSIDNYHVVLVAGEPVEVATIRRVFRQFVESGHTTARIAKALNVKGIESPGDGGWKTRHILACLRNEAYARPIRYRRKKARRDSRRNETPDVWIHTPKASKGIVSLEQFRRAQEILSKEPAMQSSNEPQL